MSNHVCSSGNDLCKQRVTIDCIGSQNRHIKHRGVLVNCIQSGWVNKPGVTQFQSISQVVHLCNRIGLAAYTIGKSGDEFALLLEKRVSIKRSVTLEQALFDASNAAVSGDTVLLSPACASFDQYRDFEARGEHFRELVEALK